MKAFDEVVAPVVERFAPTWLLISAGFDGHRDDPLTELGLTAGDFPLLTKRALELVPPGRCVAMLEGGYDLDALSSCAAAVVATLAGAPAAAEHASSGGPGAHAVDDLRTVWSRLDR
jgi:acetoin utilization deacetylase AcuC-like enzyme